MNTGLDGRVAIVTGAGSGIGQAAARALIAEGCRVVAADRNVEAVDLLAEQHPSMCVACAGDVTDRRYAGAVVDAASTRFERLDVLITCAGVWETTRFDETSDESWDGVLEINLGATFRFARAAVGAMIPRRWGRVVTISSMAARTGGAAAGPAYVASKAGVVGLTRSLANFAGPYGVTVNCVSPGVIDTPMIAHANPTQTAATIERTPLRRLGRPEEVAAVAVMLASEGAGFVHGAHIDVTGGLIMG